jgi:hypothetical protein
MRFGLESIVAFCLHSYHVAEGVRLLASDGEGYPYVVEDVNLERSALRAGRAGVVAGESAVRRGALAATGKVNLREGDRVPGVVMNNLDGSRGRQDGLELHEELVVPAEEVLDELQHLRPTKDFLRVHVKALEELGPGAAVA